MSGPDGEERTMRFHRKTPPAGRAKQSGDRAARAPRPEVSAGRCYAVYPPLGLLAGAAVGLLLGLTVMHPHVWITVGVVAAAGALSGVALALLRHASLMRRRLR